MKRLAMLIALLAVVTAGCSAAPLPPNTPTTEPTLTASAVKLPTAVPVTDTPVPTTVPSATPYTLVRMRITEAGCCVEPMWTADGQEVLVIDKPGDAYPTALYAIDMAGNRRTVSKDVGYFSPDERYLVMKPWFETTIKDLETGDTWYVPNNGRTVSFSPDSQLIAWSRTLQGSPITNRGAVITVADVRGNNTVEVIRLERGSFAGWLDAGTLLVMEDSADGDRFRRLLAVPISGSERVELAAGSIRGVVAAPGGKWVAYTVTFDAKEPANNGLWVVSTENPDVRVQLDVFGSIQWRDGERLLIIPMEYGAESHRVVEFNAAAGKVRNLTEPENFTFRVMGNNWQVSPDGNKLVYLSAQDNALWVMELP